jgi:putative transposase
MNIMKRIRTDPAIIAYGLYLYFNSRSYRFASKSLDPIIKRTHVSIWNWVQKYSILADRFVIIGKRKVQKIFVDETLLKINGQHYWLWLAYEPNLHVCLIFHLSTEKELFLYAISFSNRYEQNLEINQSLLMELIGIMMLANG